MARRIRNGPSRAHGLGPVVIAVITGIDRYGDPYAEPRDGEGAKPRIRIVQGRRERLVPGVGDHVLVKLEGSGGRGLQGRVLKVLEAKPQQIIGVYQPHADGLGRVIPVDRKGRGREVALDRDQTLDLKPGELLSVEIRREDRLGLPSGRILERLGDVSTEKAASLIAIAAHGIPTLFSKDALLEAQSAKPALLSGREDWRTLPLITIDPVDAKDHDDAVHAEADSDPANPGGHVLTVAIADVAYYVRPGSALDADALERGNSVYFPDRVVPMLPERISNDLCSLVPDQDRAALAVRIWIDAEGNKRRHRFHRILMRSNAKLAYERAEAERTSHPLLIPLYAAYRLLAKARDSREPLDLDLPERKLVLDAHGRATDVVLRERLDAHRLIEEMMILANVCAAETLLDLKQPLLLRIHDAPSLAKMETLRTFLRTLDVDLPKDGHVRPHLFNRLIHRFASHDEAPLVNEMILRTQAQAEYSPDNIGHFGLNLRRYAHFTSPIRRYADLIVHRALIKALQLGDDGLTDITQDQLRQIGQRISAAERRAMDAERDTIDRLVAFHLADHVGGQFAGRVSGVTKSGLFVKLDRLGADGFIPAASLGRDFYRYDEALQALVGERTGESWRLGDRVEVALKEASPVQGRLLFAMLSDGVTRKHSGAKRSVRRGAAKGRPEKARLGRAARGR